MAVEITTVTATDTETGYSETATLKDEYDWNLVCGEGIELTHVNTYPKSGTIQLTLKRKKSDGE